MAWVILHREETVAFGSMPLVTRGIAAELLKVCDIVTGALVGSLGDWQGAICMRLGAHPRERKAVRSALDQLMSSGYLCSKSGVIWITNFETYQSKKAKRGATHPAPNVDASSTDGSRIVDGSSTDGSRMVVATSTDDAPNDRPNASESFGFEKNNTYIQTDKQTEKQGAQGSPPGLDYFGALDAVNEARIAAGAGAVAMLGREEQTALIRHVDQVAKSHPADPGGRLRESHAAWLASEDAKSDYARRRPMAAWLANPDGALNAAKAKRRPRRPSWRDDDRPILADLSLKFDPEAVS